MFYNQEFVYFITDGDSIKIGYSARDIAHRIMELQTGNPRPLKLLGIIPCAPQTAFDKEQELHKKFAQHQKIGGGIEWFEDVPHIHAEYKKSLYDHSIQRMVTESACLSRVVEHVDNPGVTRNFSLVSIESNSSRLHIPGW